MCIYVRVCLCLMLFLSCSCSSVVDSCVCSLVVSIFLCVFLLFFLVVVFLSFFSSPLEGCMGRAGPGMCSGPLLSNPSFDVLVLVFINLYLLFAIWT
eukprot:m.23500 g.23500  ORF g.23500 m.23500 type:complete len:97 (+) comp8514_c0_seq2:698-988(+)